MWLVITFFDIFPVRFLCSVHFHFSFLTSVLCIAQLKSVYPASSITMHFLQISSREGTAVFFKACGFLLALS